MAISIDWPSKTISVQRTDTDICTLVSGTLYTVDTVALWEEIKALEDDEDGIVELRIVVKNPSVTISGVTYVPAYNIINGYQLQFLPDSQWTALMDGASNNNFHDVGNGVLVQNQVQVIPQNSAGNTVTETGVSGLTASESSDLSTIRKVVDPKKHTLADGDTGNEIIYDDDGVTPFRTYNITDETGDVVQLNPGDPAQKVRQ